MDAMGKIADALRQYLLETDEKLAIEKEWDFWESTTELSREECTMWLVQLASKLRMCIQAGNLPPDVEQWIGGNHA